MLKIAVSDAEGKEIIRIEQDISPTQLLTLMNRPSLFDEVMQPAWANIKEVLQRPD